MQCIKNGIAQEILTFSIFFHCKIKFLLSLQKENYALFQRTIEKVFLYWSYELLYGDRQIQFWQKKCVLHNSKSRNMTLNIHITIKFFRNLFRNIRSFYIYFIYLEDTFCGHKSYPVSAGLGFQVDSTRNSVSLVHTGMPLKIMLNVRVHRQKTALSTD